MWFLFDRYKIVYVLMYEKKNVYYRIFFGKVSKYKFGRFNSNFGLYYIGIFGTE